MRTRIRTRSMLAVKGMSTMGSLSAGEALAAAGGNWTPSMEPLFLRSGAEVKDRRAVINPVTGGVIGVTGPDYAPLPNSLLVEGMERLATSLGQPYRMLRADVVEGGRMVRLEAMIGDPKPIVVGDLTARTVSVWQGHGGYYPFHFLTEIKRVVCANGAAVQIPGLSTAFRVRHTSGAAMRVEWKFDQIQASFGPAVEQVEAKFGLLAGRSLSRPEALKFFRAYAQENLGQTAEKLDQTVTDLGAIWDNHRQQLAGDNYWRAYNAITEWTQWGGFRTAEASLVASSVGRTVQAKVDALEFAVAAAA